MQSLADRLDHIAPKRDTEADPDSYRLQVREYHDEPCQSCSQQHHVYGRVLWEEPPSAHLTWDVPSRWRAAQGQADALREIHQCGVAVGFQSIDKPRGFEAEYCIGWRER